MTKTQSCRPRSSRKAVRLQIRFQTRSRNFFPFAGRSEPPRCKPSRLAPELGGSRVRLLRGAAGIAHRTFAPHEIANRLYATQHRFGIHGCREGFMNAERKLRLHLPAGIASLLRQIAAGFVERDRVAIGERAKEQIRSSRIYLAGWSEGLFHLASIRNE